MFEVENNEFRNVKQTFVPVSRVLFSTVRGLDVLLPGNRNLRSVPGGEIASSRLSQGSRLLVDFGVELSGGVRIVSGADSSPDCRICLSFGESVSEALNGPLNEHGIHCTELQIPRYASIDFGTTGFRFVSIEVRCGTLDLINVIANTLDYCPEAAGSFHSSDPLLDRIFEAGVRTVRLNTQEFVFDGVKRDRLVWAGDLYPELSVILPVFGNLPALPASFDFLRETVPDSGCINKISAYTLWYVLSLYKYFLYTGDTALLDRSMPFVERAFELLKNHVSADGKENLPPNRFLDWPSNEYPEEVHAGLQGICVLAASAMAELFKCTQKDPSEAEKLHALLLGHTPDPGRNKAAAALLTLAGTPGAAPVLVQEPFRGVSTFMGYFILMAQNAASGIELARNYWGGMLKMGATTFWEDFDLDWMENAFGIDKMPVPGKVDIHKDCGAYCYKSLRHSLCHGWAGGVSAWCVEKLLGVRVLEAGCRTLEIKPDIGGLEYVQGSVCTPCGKVSISLEQGKTPEVSAPEGVNIKL